jgi:hypothetical protein
MIARVSLLAVVMMVSAGNVASAQGAYVSAAVMADVVRSTHSDYPGLTDSGGGEAIGFALRAGTPLGATWGVELEFARPGEIEHELAASLRSSVLPTVVDIPRVLREDAAFTQLLPEISRFPGSSYRVRSTERNSTLSAALWLQQQLTARFSMVYLGGVAFSRTELANEITYAPFILTPPSIAPVILPATLSETIVYGVQPLVGVESRIGMTDRLNLVPGLRMQASGGRWFIRPALGLSWNF